MCSAFEQLLRSAYGANQSHKDFVKYKLFGIKRPSSRAVTEFGELAWGTKEIPGSFNARIERLGSSPLWSGMKRGSMEIGGYFEPRGTGTPRNAWYIPGPFKVQIVANNDFFSIVTQEPWPELEHVHNRMPAIIGHPDLHPIEVGPAVWKNKTRDECIDPKRSFVDPGQKQLF